MKFILPIILSMLFIISNDSLHAENLRIGNYKYLKELNLISKNTNSKWARVELDEEIYRSSYYSDLRLVYENKLIPFKRSSKYEQSGESGTVIPRVIYERTEDNKKVYLLEIPSIPNNRVMEYLGIYSNDIYESQVRLLLGNEIDQWNESRSIFLYKYNSPDFSSNQNLNLKSKYYKYIRLELDKTLNLEFPKLYYGVEEKLSKLVFPQEIPEPEMDGDISASVYYFPNEQSLPFQSINIEFEEDNYNRRFEFHTMNEEKEYQFASSGTFHRDTKRSYVSNDINIQYTHSKPWKLIIYNEDNPSITIKSVKITHPKEVLEFSLEDIEPKSGNYEIILAYGYKYSSLPSFDLTGFPSFKEVSYVNFKLREEKENPEFGYSINYPPLSIWVIRFVFLIGVLGVSFLSFKVFNRWKRISLDKSS